MPALACARAGRPVRPLPSVSEAAYGRLAVARARFAALVSQFSRRRGEDALPEAEESLAPNLYEAPIAEVEHVERETESYVLWVVVLGFVAYALALYWAHRCHRRGGDPQITFSVLKGFRVQYIAHKRSYPHSGCRKKRGMQAAI